jgi:hypothetical protein
MKHRHLTRDHRYLLLDRPKALRRYNYLVHSFGHIADLKLAISIGLDGLRALKNNLSTRQRPMLRIMNHAAHARGADNGSKKQADKDTPAENTFHVKPPGWYSAARKTRAGYGRRSGSRGPCALTEEVQRRRWSALRMRPNAQNPWIETRKSQTRNELEILNRSRRNGGQRDRGTNPASKQHTGI